MGRKIYTRFSPEEEDELIRLIGVHGIGQWEKIREIGVIRGFFEDRTATNLKDKWRNIEKREQNR